MIVEIILLLIIIFSVGIGVYKIMFDNENKTENIINQEIGKQEIFDYLPIFKHGVTSNSDQSYIIDEQKKDFDEKVKNLENQVLEDNEKIEKFNVDFYNFHDRINNNTDNFNNSVDNINRNMKINNFKSFENDKKTIAEFYDSVTSII